MKVAITGATGFVGRYIVRKMHAVGNSCRCWFRSENNCYESPTSADMLEWTHGELGSQAACNDLLKGCDAVVHSGLHRTGESFRGGEGDTAAFGSEECGWHNSAYRSGATCRRPQICLHLNMCCPRKKYWMTDRWTNLIRYG